MTRDLKEKIKFLRLSYLQECWSEIIKTARDNDLSHEALLKYVIDQIYIHRKEQARISRIRRAKMTEEYTIETYPFKKQPKLKKTALLSIYDSLDYMTVPQNIIWIGPTGSGKSGLATSFLFHAINNGYTGRFITFPELMNTLYKSLADQSQQKVLDQFANIGCLAIDELGYVEVEPAQVGLFFTLMDRRHKKKPTLITSNLGFDGWASFLKNDHLTAALIDRLTSNSHIINMKSCSSIRPLPKTT